MIERKLKLDIDDFDDVIAGRRTHDIREEVVDPPFAVGDCLIFEEWSSCSYHCRTVAYRTADTSRSSKAPGEGPCICGYTGRNTSGYVNCVTKITPNIVVMSFGPKPLNPRHDPKFDPMAGDFVVTKDQGKAEVIEVSTDRNEYDQKVGALPYVHAFMDSPGGQRMRVIIGIQAWREWAAS